VAQVTIEQARAAKERLRAMLSGHAAVNGIGITGGGDQYAVKVNLLHALPSGEIPSEVDGVRVETNVVGKIAKLPAEI
jgi:hypothetical protein